MTDLALLRRDPLPPGLHLPDRLLLLLPVLGLLLLPLLGLLLLRPLLGLLLLRSLPSLLLGLSLLGGWGFIIGRLGLLLLLLLMLCTCRNCDPESHEEKCGVDDSDWLHFVLLI